MTRNNAKSAISNLEYQLEQLKEEKSNIALELQESRESAAELQVQAQCHLEDKLQLKSVLTETQKQLVLNEKRMSEMEKILNEEKRIKMEKVKEKIIMITTPLVQFINFPFFFFLTKIERRVGTIPVGSTNDGSRG